jgi:hypothetical protein
MFWPNKFLTHACHQEIWPPIKTSLEREPYERSSLDNNYCSYTAQQELRQKKSNINIVGGPIEAAVRKHYKS